MISGYPHLWKKRKHITTHTVDGCEILHHLGWLKHVETHPKSWDVKITVFNW